jgi:hypothetical protein
MNCEKQCSISDYYTSFTHNLLAYAMVLPSVHFQFASLIVMEFCLPLFILILAVTHIQHVNKQNP